MKVRAGPAGVSEIRRKIFCNMRCNLELSQGFILVSTSKIIVYKSFYPACKNLTSFSQRRVKLVPSSGQISGLSPDMNQVREM